MMKCVAYAMGKTLPSNVDDPTFEPDPLPAQPALLEDPADTLAAHAADFVLEVFRAATHLLF